MDSEKTLDERNAQTLRVSVPDQTSASAAYTAETKQLNQHGKDNTILSFSILLVVLLFQQVTAGVSFPIAKYGLTQMEPFTFAFFRYLLSSLVLLFMMRIMNHEKAVERKDFWKIIGLGILIIPFNQTMFIYGQSLTSSAHSAILFATTPLWIFLLALIHLKEKFIWRRACGVLIAFSGVILMMTAGTVELGRDYLLGDSLVLLAVVVWAYYTILGKPLVQKYGAFRVTAYAIATGSLVYFPFGLYQAVNYDYSGVGAGAWGAIAYMAIGTSIFAYGLWYWLLKYMHASRIAAWQNIQPMVASAVAFTWLGEPLGLSFIVGGAVILGGVIISETRLATP